MTNKINEIKKKKVNDSTKIELFIDDNEIKFKKNNEIKKVEIKDDFFKNGIILNKQKFKNMLKEISIENENVTLSFDSSEYNITLMDFPPNGSLKDLKEMIKHRYPFKEYSYSFYQFKNQLICITINKQIIKSIFNVLCELKSKDKVIEHNIFKILKSFENTKKSIIYIEKNNSYIFIFNGKEEMDFFRKLELGNSNLKNQLDGEKLINDIYRSFDYYQIEFDSNLESVLYINKREDDFFKLNLEKRLGLEIEEETIESIN